MGCGPGGSSFRIKGTLNGQEGGEIYIYNTSYTGARFDTIKVEAGQFVYGGSVDEVTPYILLFPNALEQVIFVGPGDVIEYTASVTNLNNYTAEGNKDNDLMAQFRKQIEGLSDHDAAAAARQFIQSYPQSAVSAYLDDIYMRKGKKQLTELPDLTLVPNDKKAVKLWSKDESQYTLTTFWATWMMSSYDFMNRLRYVRGQHPDPKQLRIVAVSLDIERFRWQDETRRDSTNHIEHYCDGKAWESEVVTKAGVSDVPSYYITDSKHKILYRGTSVDALLNDIDKVLKK